MNTAAFLFRGQHFQSSTGSDALALTAAVRGTQHRCIQGLHCCSRRKRFAGSCSSCSSTLLGWRCCFARSIRLLLRSKAKIPKRTEEQKRNNNLWQSLQSRNPFETSSEFLPSRQRSCTASMDSLHNSLHRRTEFSTSGGLQRLLKTILAAESQGLSKSANVLMLRSLPHHFQGSADPGSGRPR